ncbi:hypothetical protein DFJ77DRAFT_42038 [Powellomyces hirtus]|nr:hypothetical protein DFJ77DRAFT_42038 [Powellomyces hirtus]
MASTGKRKQDDLVGNGEKKVKKRVRIGETEFLGAAEGQVYPPREVDDSEDLETLKGRRGAVRLEGYDSESDSNEDDDATAAAAGNDDDMFADIAPEPPAAGPMGKKGEKFLKSENIEGQEWMDDVDEFSGEVKLTPFNMEEEMEEGNFDESGHYIRKRDEHLIHDSWLQGVTKDDMERARAAHERQQEQSNADEASEDQDISDPNHIWLKAIHLMKPGESIPKSLRRLAGNKPNQSTRNKWNKKKREADKARAEAEKDPQAEDRKQALDQLTSYADKLMGLGVLDVYENTYEQVVRKLRSADLLYEDWQPPTE